MVRVLCSYVVHDGRVAAVPTCVYAELWAPSVRAPHIVVRKSECVSDLVRAQLPVALQHGTLDLGKELACAA